MAFKIKQNDTRPRYVVPLVDNFEEPGEAPIDLTDAESVVFIMRPKGTTEADGPPTVRAAAEFLGERKNGVVQYTWDPSDTENTGDFVAEFEIGWKDGGVETVPNETEFEIVIVPDLG